jgi:nucleoid-associated protein YgaU
VRKPRERAHVVRAGDNLWRIAETELTRATGGAPAESDIARYWQRVIAANRTTLRSGDPSLILPGEVVTLPLD